MRGRMLLGQRAWTVGLGMGCLLAALAVGRAEAAEVAYVSDIDCCTEACAPTLACNACSERLWVGIDYLRWQLSGTDLPPLVTASPTGTALDDAGVLGDATTQILAGNREIGDGPRNGFRIDAGWWLDGCQSLAITGSYFDTGRDNYGFRQSEDPALIVTRPFYNTQLDELDTELVSLQNELDGDVTVAASDEFRGAALMLQRCLRRCGSACSCGPGFEVDLVGGYRYYQYNSQLNIFEDLTVLAGTSQPLVPGTTIQVSDRFGTRNEFHGGEVGLKCRVRRSYYWLDGLASVAVGANHRRVAVAGSTVNTVPGSGTASYVGGLLTSEVTNIGYYSDTQSAVVPNFRLAVGCQLTGHLSGHVGYNAIVWDDVAQAAAHLPPGLEVDPRNLPPVVAGGGAEPAFPGIQGTTMVAHGLDLGLEFTY